MVFRAFRDVSHHNQSTPAALAFYDDALVLLRDRRIPFLVGGGYAVHVYTGIARATKDFDLFVRPDDVGRILDLFAAEGYRTELTYPHWLAKVWSGAELIDVIFSSGNGLCAVDELWFARAVDGIVLDHPVKVCPPEETIWQKSFIMERDRYDGADIAHLLRVRGRQLDWPRLLERFGSHWRVLYAHLILFRYIYPGERAAIPDDVLEELAARAADERRQPPVLYQTERLCRGTLFSRQQYQIDVDEWGYQDARLLPEGRMTPADAATWIAGDPPAPFTGESGTGGPRWR
jgi:hypothetical protein